MFRLSYLSTVSVLAGSRFVSAMEDILIESVRNNRRDGLTGLLLCDGFSFAQALEGERAQVEACYARILTDPRHERVTLCAAGVSDERAFDRWSMCGLTLSSADDALLGPGDLDFDLHEALPGAVWQHLTGLARRQAAALDAQHARLLSIGASGEGDG